ncbi:cytochrome c3 family protein [Hanstruepera neustonica]|uniref:cytochrome c3 family protein n=1 Tax=Hanstruepera neustonica TaxID=1445657 RepID=UPI000C9F6713|nr:cytochrome c3 family protein [Hanstruepera neustonica]
MYRLPFIIVLICLSCTALWAQSPHGDGLKIDCSQCHNPDGWTVDYRTTTFDHSTTNFTLEGAHKNTDCKSCHNTLVFDNTPNDCLSCHTDVHEQSVGNDCVRCHNTQNWLVFNVPEIHEANGFPLIGAHFNVNCSECHQGDNGLIFTPVGNECIECHQTDFMATTSPNHSISGFSTDCTECHSPTGMGWGADGFIHDFFPLTGGHHIQDCSRCHDVSNFSDISPECVSCHEDDYIATTNPNHTSAGFPTNCAECHSTGPGWTPATINHDFFPLSGGHDINDCTACHINGNYTNTPTDCVACHQDDYNTTNDPNHQAANFPTDCASCHTTNPGWTPATFDHDGQYFPIYTGRHDNEWSSCTDCHTNSNDYSVYTCITCHTQGNTADQHEDVNDYVYQSSACLQCHPDGSD